MLYRCSEEGCTVRRVSSIFKSEEKLENPHELFPLTPSTATLWQPYPPYSSIDLEVVIDSDPKLEVYGLPVRRSNVIAMTKRTVLEGRSPLQLVTVKGEDVVDEVSALVSGWLGFEVSAPLAPRDLLGEPTMLSCHLYSEPEKWGECMFYNYRPVESLKEYAKRVEESVKRRSYGFDRVAMLTRLYAGLAVISGLKPLELAEALLAHGLSGPRIVKSDGRYEVVPRNVKVGLYCEGGDVEVWVPASRINDVLGRYTCRFVSFICRRCLQNI